MSIDDRKQSEAERIEEARIKVLRQYAGHHASCPECYAVWREVVHLVEDPYRAEADRGKP